MRNLDEQRSTPLVELEIACTAAQLPDAETTGPQDAGRLDTPALQQRFDQPNHRERLPRSARVDVRRLVFRAVSDWRIEFDRIERVPATHLQGDLAGQHHGVVVDGDQQGVREQPADRRVGAGRIDRTASSWDSTGRRPAGEQLDDLTGRGRCAPEQLS